MIRAQLPPQGIGKDTIASELESMRKGDADWRNARTFSLVYHAGNELLDVTKDAYLRFFSENALNPVAFPSLRRFERAVVGMTASMLNAKETAAGTMTSGGSESLLMAVKTARDWAREHKPEVKAPEMLLPVSAHPALHKAAHYFDVKVVHVPLRADFRADAHAAEALVTDNTILMMGSAPAYPHGVIDPITDLAKIAKGRGILMHVDACLGGFLLPFLEKNGRALPAFDFRVPGVTSMSADVHKYGYAAKGASVVLYESQALRRHQFFTYADWPGGLYGSPSMTGTRPGGAIAAAWAIMNHLGQEGYLRLAKETMAATDTLSQGIRSIPELHILGEPDASVIAFSSDALDVYMLGDAMEAKGWKLDRQQRPPCLHMMVTPAHGPVAANFLSDLRQCVAFLRDSKPVPEGAAAMYGMLGSAPDRGMVAGALLDFMDGLDAVE
jgi:glutamate/tyrosine decarboxylase-like PLP-dependent enzyme